MEVPKRICGASYHVGNNKIVICRREEGHPPYDEDKIGHWSSIERVLGVLSQADRIKFAQLFYNLPARALPDQGTTPQSRRPTSTDELYEIALAMTEYVTHMRDQLKEINNKLNALFDQIMQKGLD